LTKIANVKDASLDANAVNAMNEAAGTLSAPVNSAVPVAVAPKAAMPLGGDRMASLQAMLAAYGPKDGAYDAELKLARARATADSDAFARMLTTSMSSPEDAQSSKAEMYFRLAAAFGAPTKTGQFSENLGMVGKELGEFAKGKRASAREKQLLGLEVQKLKMASSKDDLNTLRALSAEEMKDKRAISIELIKDYVRSGEPQSAAGKQALDEGFTKGTPEFEKRAKEIFALTVDAKTSQLQAQLAGMSLTQAKLISEQLNTQTMSDAELTKVLGTKEVIGTLEGAIGDVRQAITLNQNAYGGSLGEATEENITKIFLPKDQKLINTRLLKNFLSAQGVAKLRASFGGNPTEGERAILLSLEGIDALSSKERDAIMIRTLDALDKKLARERTTLEGLQSGSLRRYTQPQTLTPPTAGKK
jgi:hypothetical protein